MTNGLGAVLLKLLAGLMKILDPKRPSRAYHVDENFEILVLAWFLQVFGFVDYHPNKRQS